MPLIGKTDNFIYFSGHFAAIFDSGDRIATPTSVLVLQPVITHTMGVVDVVVVVCFHDLKFCISSQVKAASCAWCSSEMPPSKQVNGHSFTICFIFWCSPQSQSGEAM